MKNIQSNSQPTLRSSDTLFRPDFMLQPKATRVLPTPAQLSQRKALNTKVNSYEDATELVDVEWWQDR